MMPVLLAIVVPLAAFLIVAVVFDVGQRRRLRSAPGRHDISAAADMARAISDARTSQHIAGGGGGVGGV